MEEVLEKVSRNKAIQILGLSRHTFDKLIEDKSITVHEEEKKKFYYISELEKFMTTQEYKAAFNGVVDKRNSLNDLTGKEWLPETKSYLYQRGLGADSPEAQIEKQHPAPYSFQDIGHFGSNLQIK